jgi:hypothetical protein
MRPVSLEAQSECESFIHCIIITMQTNREKKAQLAKCKLSSNKSVRSGCMAKLKSCVGLCSEFCVWRIILSISFLPPIFLSPSPSFSLSLPISLSPYPFLFLSLFIRAVIMQTRWRTPALRCYQVMQMVVIQVLAGVASRGHLAPSRPPQRGAVNTSKIMGRPHGCYTLLLKDRLMEIQSRWCCREHLYCRLSSGFAKFKRWFILIIKMNRERFLKYLNDQANKI